MGVDGWGEPDDPVVPEQLTWPTSRTPAGQVDITSAAPPSAVTLNTFTRTDRNGVPDEGTQRTLECTLTKRSGADCIVDRRGDHTWGVSLTAPHHALSRYTALNAEWTDTHALTRHRFMAWQLPVPASTSG